MIKKIFFILCCLLNVLAVYADWQGDGYYRVQNYGSGRYAYVLDNHAKVDLNTTTVDLKAIELWKDPDKFHYNPSTVLYIKKVGNQYDIISQGTSVHEMIDQYVSLAKFDGDPAYSAYGKYSGVTKYLADPTFSSRDSSYMSDQRRAENYNLSLWNIIPVSSTTDNYVSIKPTLKVGGKHYATMFCDFSYSFVPTGMKGYYVSYVDSQRGLAIYKQIVSGNIPAKTPVFIECPSENHSDNKVNVGTTATSVTDNKMSGVYFCKNNANHVNLTEFKVNTMRELGVMPDGTLGFVAPTTKYVPRNTAFLNVPEGTPANVKLVTQEEYDYILAHEVVEAQSVTLSSTSLTLLLGAQATLTATVSPANTTDKTVTWASSNSAVVSVEGGVLTACGLGTATITATCGKASASCVVTVNPIPAESVTLSAANLTLLLGGEADITATVAPDNTTDKTVVWSSSDTSVATVSSNGHVVAVGLGTATVTAKCGDVSASCAVTVNPIVAESVTLNHTTYTLLLGQTATLTATVSPANTTDQTITWQSSNPDVATITSAGVVTAVSVGQTTITARCGEAYATCLVTVNPIPSEGVILNMTSVELTIGDDVTLQATVLPENTTDKTVVWTTSDAAIAAVDNNGHVVAVAAGDAVITATSGTASATCVVKVKRMEQQIVWEQDFKQLEPGDEIKLLATATSGLEVSYEIVSGNDIAVIAGSTLRVTGGGEVTVKAVQAGNDRYMAAAPVFVTISIYDAVESVTANALAVRVLNCAIEVSGVADGMPVEVYTLSGARAYSGTSHIIPLRPDTYIVRVGDARVKLVVK